MATHRPEHIEDALRVFKEIAQEPKIEDGR
jgi:hypothetical protein